MASELIVEGPTDEAFFKNICLKFFGRHLSEIGLGIIPGGSRDQAKVILRRDVRAGFSRIAIALDINSRTPEDVLDEVRDDLASEVGHSIEAAGNWLIAADSKVLAIPMGLCDDADLNRLGVTRHAVEDYLVKLVVQDPGLTKDVSNFSHLLQETLSLFKANGIVLDSSKYLLSLIKAIFKFPYADPSFTKKIFGQANEDIARQTMSDVLAKLSDFFLTLSLESNTP